MTCHNCGIDTQEGLTMIGVALYENRLDVIRLLSGAGLDVNEPCEHASTAQIGRFSSEMLGTSHAPLFIAVRYGFHQAVKCLVSCGADIDAVDEAGNTLLQLAYQRDFGDIWRFLVCAGADVNKNVGVCTSRTFSVDDIQINTPLLVMALSRREVEDAIFLIQFGADIHIADEVHMTI